jgi:hypothetical protein
LTEFFVVGGGNLMKKKNKFQIFEKVYLPLVGALLLILLALLLLWFYNSTSTQAVPALIAQVRFEGEYQIGDSAPHKIVEGEHISSTKGDVILRGNFHMYAPDGEYVGIYRGELPIAFYVNHISLTFVEGDGEPFLTDMENPLYGKSACGVSWTAHTFMSSEDEIIEIRIHNPHSYGNENAIDEMLSGIALWSGIEFEKATLESGDAQRDIGLVLVIFALMLLGIALFSSLIHIKSSPIIWQTGLVAMFAGIYFAYSVEGVSLWSESVVSNTSILGFSMIFYMLFLVMSIVFFLRDSKKIGNIAIIVMTVADAILCVLPVIRGIYFYDVWPWWICVQTAVNIVLAVCLVKEFLIIKKRERWLYLGSLLPLIAFSIDAIGVWLGLWKGGVISKYLFIILFAVALILALRLVPQSINATAKAKELEMEKIVLNAQLADSRIATMMSQIRPHFVYNTLGSIEQLCKLDPPKAGELVHNFAKYLRGNFGEIDNPKPILMSQEMEHVRYYISIENVRFPDMTFTFEMNSDDFHIPALTIQPIVENAIKHGLMKLRNGGTIRVATYETDTAYYISVEDDGVGFDTNALLDDRKHVGIRNIRERLKVMVNGTLEIESKIGVGTKVVVKIPKEVEK